MQTTNRSKIKWIAKLILPPEIRVRMRSVQNKLQALRAKKREAAWEKVAARVGHLIYRIAPKVKMKLYCDSSLSRTIYLEEFEPDERDFMLRFLRPGDLFVDVGANAGLFTLIAARVVGPRGRVFAFEPVSGTCERLAENIRLNEFENVQIQQCALSDSNGKSSMMVAEDDMDAFNSFATPYIGEHYSQKTVTTAKWDDFAEQNSLGSRVTFMKIDVEGWETNVLAGGRHQLSREDAPVLQVEFTDKAAKAAGTSCKENYRLIEEMGYKLYSYDRRTKTLRPDAFREEYPYLNLYAIKDLAAAQLRLDGN